jgi:hypothetical protein
VIDDIADSTPRRAHDDGTNADVDWKEKSA